jgi:hypothetical protein
MCQTARGIWRLIAPHRYGAGARDAVALELLAATGAS